MSNRSVNGRTERRMFELAEKPSEGKCFRVDPKTILLKSFLFSKRKRDGRQEETRIMILKSIEEVKRNLDKYETFYLLIPEKIWVYGKKSFTTANEQLNFTKRIGGNLSNWITEPLVWAQRIINGESWRAVCNDPDTLKWHRLVVWEHNEIKKVGGACEIPDRFSSSVIHFRDFPAAKLLFSEVPSIIINSFVVFMSSV